MCPRLLARLSGEYGLQGLDYLYFLVLRGHLPCTEPFGDEVFEPVRVLRPAQVRLELPDLGHLAGSHHFHHGPGCLWRLLRFEYVRAPVREAKLPEVLHHLEEPLRGKLLGGPRPA